MPPGGTAAFELETADLVGVNWNKLHAVAFVDYRPAGEVYDILQAAMAIPLDFIVRPSELIFLIDPVDPVDPGASLQLRGPLDLAWSAVESLSWLFLSATTGSILESPTLSIDTGELSAGWQSGIVELSASAAGGPTYTKQVSIQIYFGQVERIFLPLMSR